ncbi:MAG: hypothetical protein ABW081_03635, partial [Solirubrobacteraceae bacterium]
MALQGVGVTAVACQRRQLGLRTQTVRAELDAIQGGVASARSCEALADHRVGVRPGAFREGVLGCERILGQRAALVIADADERRL